MTSGIISLANNIASKVGEAGCDQVMLKFPSGHFLFMSIGNLAGFVAPFVVGYAKDMTGSAAVGMYAIAGGLVVGAICTLLTPAKLVNR